MADLATDLLGAPLPHREAEFWGDDMRATLSRTWDNGPRALVIGCNPSTADALTDDPTTRWWTAWFRWAGFAGFDAVNLYPFIATDPVACRARADAAGNGRQPYDRDALHANRDHVARRAKAASQVFVCWGAIAWDPLWVDSVVEAVVHDEEPWPSLWCWGVTASGAPKHPLARGAHRIDPRQPPILWRDRLGQGAWWNHPAANDPG